MKEKGKFFFLAPRLGFDFFDFDEAGPPQICGLCSVRFASANERTALSRRRQSDLNGVGSAFCYFFLRKYFTSQEVKFHEGVETFFHII